MHVILGLLGTVVTILYLLNRLGGLGIDFGWLNPFHWRRRRNWAAKYESDPIYSVEDPIHVAALLVIGAAKLDGDLSVGQKQTIIDQFQTKFSLDAKEASGLLGSAAHLLAAPQLIGTQLSGLASKNKEHFSEQQAESVLDMMSIVASSDGELSNGQRAYIDEIRSLFATPKESGGTWD